VRARETCRNAERKRIRERREGGRIRERREGRRKGGRKYQDSATLLVVLDKKIEGPLGKTKKQGNRGGEVKREGWVEQGQESARESSCTQKKE